MTELISWDSVDSQKWTYSIKEKDCSYLIYKVDKLPDFTEPRFSYLCKEHDQRASEVVKRQQQMIREFHSLGNDWGISFRLVKDSAITIYLIFRYAGDGLLGSEEIMKYDSAIRNALITNEYSFIKVDSDNNDCFDISWAREAAEISKNEKIYNSDEYPDGSLQEFYSSDMWAAADNRMESICSTLMNHMGRASVEITIEPSRYLFDEKEWVSNSLRRLKDCMNGETFRNEKGKILWQGNKLPILKTPIENYEKMNKQYESSRIFLSSIRIYADENAYAISNSFLTNCVKNQGTVQLFRKGDERFEFLSYFYRTVNVSANIHTEYWNTHENDAPFRAQRLCRLCSVEEISNFFRLPVPVKPGFPGFALDTGLKDFSGKKKNDLMIRLGTYLDVQGHNESPAEFGVQQFAKHGLIVGVPGSGKTTAMFNILYQLWAVPEEEKIPFIILEPAKTEYRALKKLSEFRDDMIVFTLGDENVSPFRFNPMEVLPGIKLETHISKLHACFVGAFDLFDPLTYFLEQAIRKTYYEKGWYDDSKGGEPGVETPTLSDLCRNAEYLVSHSGFDEKMKSDFNASLLERLNSLRRGSKGRMLDTIHTIPIEDLMGKPVVIELDSLNGNEKSLMMMFILTYVYEYCKVRRKSGSRLKHMLLVEEAHNLISSGGSVSENRANPRAQTIELFTNMLAEMRALGQGILIADQLPTAIAPQAVKQTNVKILMRETAKDDREEIGNTMDLNEEQMHQVVNFKTGHAYLYHEGEDHVRMIRMLNFKGEHDVEEPPEDNELKELMAGYEQDHSELYMPFKECREHCVKCNRRVRNQAESFVRMLFDDSENPFKMTFSRKSGDKELSRTIGLCSVCGIAMNKEIKRIEDRYGSIGAEFGACVYLHMMNEYSDQMLACGIRGGRCSCEEDKKQSFLLKYKEKTQLS